jgi:hypothetical protein
VDFYNNKIGIISASGWLFEKKAQYVFLFEAWTDAEETDEHRACNSTYHHQTVARR